MWGRLRGLAARVLFQSEATPRVTIGWSVGVLALALLVPPSALWLMLATTIRNVPLGFGLSWGFWSIAEGVGPGLGRTAIGLFGMAVFLLWVMSVPLAFTLLVQETARALLVGAIFPLWCLGYLVWVRGPLGERLLAALLLLTPLVLGALGVARG
jgi:hypothetical protein